MSDNEVPPPGAPGGTVNFDDDKMGSLAAGDYLPQGITKEILTEAPAENWRRPEIGDKVTIHFVGTLERDGSEFDSSRSLGEPLVFTLGKGHVLRGLDVGLPTMKRGEVAKFTLAPEFGYGDQGNPPSVPAKATLCFEVELLGWSRDNDLFGDDGVIRKQLREGSGSKIPQAGDEVLLTLKAEAPDGSIVEERVDFEYVVGSESLGNVGRACEKAMLSMKRGGEVSLKCSKDYAYADKTPEGATVTLTLQEIYETSDISFGKDQSIMKKQVHEGEGYEKPRVGSKVKLSVVAATDGVAPLPGFTPKVLEFLSGDGEVCDALECAAAEMKKGEKAVLTVAPPSMAQEEQLGLEGVAADKVVLTLALLEFEKGEDAWSMSEEERVEFGTACKERGSELFKAGRLHIALRRYGQAGEVLGGIEKFKEKNKAKAKELRKACELNKAAVHLKLHNFDDAHEACEAVLKEDSQNVKAIFRRAQAEHGLHNFQECIRDCKRVVELDAKNREARELLKQAQAGRKEEDRTSKGLFTNMCKALGTDQ